MRAFIQYKQLLGTDRKAPFGFGAYVAEDWFLQMGWECIPFLEPSELEGHISFDTPVIGGIRNVLLALDHLGVRRPVPLEIPEELFSYCNRKIWLSSLGEVRKHEDNWPVFIKPSEEHKLFTGHVLRNFTDLFKAMAFPDETKVIVSEPVQFDSEYRCFVCRGEILDVRRYTGAVDWYPDIPRVRDMIRAIRKPLAAYSIDVGSVAGETVLVECNDAYALGTYGLSGHHQVKMILGRWQEMCSVENRIAT